MSDEARALLRARFDRAKLDARIPLVRSTGPFAPHGIRLCSNDYLSLSNHPHLVRAMQDAIGAGGDSLWMSSVFLEDDSPQRKVERRLAAYVGAEDCVLMQSGYCANLGLLQSIAGPGVRVYIDECAHASLWHGLLACRATPRRFAHNQPAALEALLQKASGQGVVVVDTIYSHDGSVCPLEDIVALATHYGCLLVVDESHSLGTHGPAGAGMVVELGLSDQVHLRSASLAKAFVSRAGMVAGSELACRLVRYAAGPAIFSSACMAHDLAGIEGALELIMQADDRRARLHASAAELRARLDALGYAIASQSQIVALESGLESETLRLRELLDSNAVYGSAFCAPATRVDESLIRLSLHADLGRAQLDRIVEVCAGVREQVAFSDWASTRRRGELANDKAPSTSRRGMSSVDG